MLLFPAQFSTIHLYISVEEAQLFSYIRNKRQTHVITMKGLVQWSDSANEKELNLNIMRYFRTVDARKQMRILCAVIEAVI